MKIGALFQQALSCVKHKIPIYVLYFSFLDHSRGLLEPIPATCGGKVSIWGFDTLLKGTLTVLWKCPGTAPYYLMFCLHVGLNQEPSAAQPSLLFYLFILFLFMFFRVALRHLELKDSSLVLSLTDHAVLSVPGNHEWWKPKKKEVEGEGGGQLC